MKPASKKWLLGSCSILLLGLIHNPVKAADNLEEIVVTAQVRPQFISNVPLSVSALTETLLRDAAIRDIRDIAHHEPTLEVQTNTSPIQVGYRIRRVGNLSNIPTFESAVGVYVDGAFRLQPLFAAGELVDIERVEILRGPQTTLYGKNATAGVVGIYTKLPSDNLKAMGEYTAGRIEGASTAPLQRFKGGMSGPLSDTLRASVSIGYAGHGHTGESALLNSNVALNEQNRAMLRGQLYWGGDSSDVRLLIGALRQNEDSSDGDLYYDPTGWVATAILPALQATGISTPCTSNNSRDRKSCVRNAVHSDLNARDATLIGNYHFDNAWTLTSISSWDHYHFVGRWDDVAQLAAPLIRFHDRRQAESYQQQLRLLSPGNEKVDWLGGVFFYTNRFRFGDPDRPEFLSDADSANPTIIAINNRLFGKPIPLAVPGQEGYFASGQNIVSESAFVQATWNANDHLAVTSGVRWLRETKQGYLNNAVNDPAPSFISLVLAPTSINGKIDNTDEGALWSFAPSFRLNDEVQLYAVTTQGFKPGGLNIGYGNLPLDRRHFNREDVTHYEAGIKALNWNKRWRWTLALFHTDYKNYQDSAFIGSQFTVGNAELATLKGFEFNNTLAVTEHIVADASISYADFIYAKNTHGKCDPFRQPDSAIDSTACDLSGQHPINAPPWKTRLGLQFSQPKTRVEFYERIDWAWTDSYNTSASTDPHSTQRAYSWIDMRAGLRFNRYDVAIWISNALNETIVDSEAVQNVYAGHGDGSVQSYLEDGRSYGITLRASF